jgi:hypothetical protein
MRARAALVVVLALTACGGADPEPATAPAKPPSDRLVDLSKKPPLVNTLDIDPASKDFLLTTNRGFFRISSDGKRVTPVKGSIQDAGKTATVGTFLELRASGPNRLLGSGHPDKLGTLPNFLGLIRSDDGGRTWEAVARMADADLHKIILRHDRLYAFDAVLSAMLISPDGGKTFREAFTPRGLIIDFEVDPADPDRIVASTEDEVFRTEDGGESWRPLAPEDAARFAWPDAKALYRATKDGTFSVSTDGGTRWEDVGQVGGEPYEIHAMGPRAAFVALSDGSIIETQDGGATWRDRFRP